MTDTTDNTAMNGETLDIAEQRRRELKQLFPSAFTETHNARGELVHAVDFDRLKAELGSFSEFYEGKKERYGMDWPGKRDCLKLIQTPSRATLKPCREESVDFDTTQNLFIEGDNLEVLKLLQKSYYGKVKMIYIDPPYNTGNEFIYPDNYSESLDTYLAYAGLIDDEGKKFSTNTANEGRFHSKWLNMMYPRLYLARNLLREDGVIFISIDDNEVENLRRMCDEIFGEENFVSSIAWQNVYGGGSKSKHVVNINETILFFAKNKQLIGDIELPADPELRRRYKEKDEKFSIRGPYYTQPLATNSMDERENLRFAIPYNGEEIWPEKQWQWSKDRVLKALEDNELVIKKSKAGQWSVRYKQYLKDESGVERGAKLFSILNGPWSQEGTNEIKSIFGTGKVFTFPKPSRLISHLLSVFWKDSEAIILDFFAGSSATAQAVLSLNKEYPGARRYIMVPRAHYIESHKVLPDIVGFLQRETELTRGTLVQILTQCGRLNEFKLNPQAFMTEVARQIHKALNELLVDGIQYEKIDGESYEMSLFDQPEIEAYLDRLYKVQYAEQDNIVRTPYDYVEYESTVEKDIAQRLDEAENVRFFCKLPAWFKIATPIGNYNPDWAVVLEADKKLYLIRESKSSHDADDRRNKENLLIRCGAAHFAALGDVDYRVATGIHEIIS